MRSPTPVLPFVSLLAAPLVLFGIGFHTAYGQATGTTTAAANTVQAPPADVTGTVLAPDGKPVGGAQVVWLMQDEDASGSQAKPIVVTTGADGSFRFPGKTVWSQPRSWLQVIALASGYGIGCAPVTPDAKPVTVTLNAGTTLKFKVVNALGQPIPGVSILPDFLQQGQDFQSNLIMSSGIGALASGTSDADGIVSIAGLPQGWQVRFATPDKHFAQIQYPLSNVALSAEPVTTAPDLRLQKAATIAGRAVDASGKPVAGLIINGVVPSGQIPIHVTTKTDSQGRYRLEQLVPGHYLVGATLMPVMSSQWAVVPVDVPGVAAGEHRDLVTVTLVKGAVIEGTISSEDGKPVSGLQVTASDSAEIFQGPWTAAATTDVTGRYSLHTPPGIITVAANWQQSVSQTVTTTTDQTTRVDLALPTPNPSATVTGTVLDAAGKPVSDARIATIGSPFGGQSVQSDPNGHFTITDQNSLIFLRARKGDAATVQSTAALDGDTVTLHLADNALGQFSGKIINTEGQPIAGATVTPYQENGTADLNPVKSDDQGNFTVSGLWLNSTCSYNVEAKGYASTFADAFLVSEPKLQRDPVTLQHTDSFVAGHVVDSRGEPLADASVTDRSSQDNQTTTDKSGYFHLDNVPRDHVDLEVRSGDEWTSMQVNSGKTDVVIRTFSQSKQRQESAHYQQTINHLNQQAPEISTATWVNTSPVSIQDLHGEYVIFDCWGCCVDSLLKTQLLVQQLGAHGVVGIGLNVDGTNLKDVQAHIGKEKLTIPIAMDPNGQLQKALGCRGYESYVLVDRTGKIIYTGFDYGQCLQKLGALLSKEKPSGSASSTAHAGGA